MNNHVSVDGIFKSLISWPSSISTDRGQVLEGSLLFHVLVADTGNHCIRHFYFSSSTSSSNVSESQVRPIGMVWTLRQYEKPGVSTSNTDLNTPTWCPCVLAQISCIQFLFLASVSYGGNFWYVANRGKASIQAYVAVNSSGEEFPTFERRLTHACKKVSHQSKPKDSVRRRKSQIPCVVRKTSRHRISRSICCSNGRSMAVHSTSF